MITTPLKPTEGLNGAPKPTLFRVIVEIPISPITTYVYVTASTASAMATASSAGRTSCTRTM